VQHGRDLVDRGDIDGVDDSVFVDVAHERDFALVRFGDGAVAAQHEGVRLDSNRAQGGNGVLGRFGLLFAGCAEERYQGDVHEKDVAAPEFVAHLTSGLKERLGLDVSDGSADLGDDHVGAHFIAGLQAHAALDLVGDVWNDLNGVAEVFAATFLRDDLRVNLPGRHVGRLAEVDVEKALIVTDVKVGLCAVVGHKDLTVLERIHRSRVNVEIGV